MKIQLIVHPVEGDPYEVTTNLFVVVAWERKFKKQASSLANGIGAEDLAFFAFESSRAAGITTPLAFDDFIKKTREITVVGTEEGNPTEPAVSVGH
jgi:hypothetical protein